jgi:hypothetical protein
LDFLFSRLLFSGIMPAVSSLCQADATKAHQLCRDMAKGTPMDVCKTIKINFVNSTQFLFITPGSTHPKVQVLSHPLFATNRNNQPAFIGICGNHPDDLAPVATPGAFLGELTLALFPNVLVTKHDLPTLAADPLNLDAPEGADPDRLHCHFTDAKNTPVIAGVPVIFLVPIGVAPPSGWVLDPDVEITEAEFPCEAGITWIKGMTNVTACHANKPIHHTDPAVFKPEDLDLAPFDTFDIAPSTVVECTVIHPSDEQHNCVFAVTKEKALRRLVAKSWLKPAPAPLQLKAPKLTRQHVKDLL